jgi:hypothetical protein
MDRASLFAEAAPDARLWIIERGNAFIVYFAHAERLEGTARDADFTPNAVFHKHIGFGP